MRLLTLIRWLLRGRFGQLRPAFLRHVLETRYGAARPALRVLARDVWRKCSSSSEAFKNLTGSRKVWLDL